MFSVNRLTEKISVNRFSINRTETENGGQDGDMQNALNAHRGSPISYRKNYSFIAQVMHKVMPFDSHNRQFTYHKKGKQLKEVNS